MAQEHIEIIDTSWCYKAEREAGWLLATSTVKVPEGYLKAWWRADMEGGISCGLSTTDEKGHLLVWNGLNIGFVELVMVGGGWMRHSDQRNQKESPRVFSRLRFQGGSSWAWQGLVSPGELCLEDCDRLEERLRETGRKLMGSDLRQAMSVYALIRRREAWVARRELAGNFDHPARPETVDQAYWGKESDEKIKKLDDAIKPLLDKRAMAILLNHPEREVRRQCVILKATRAEPGLTRKPSVG